MLKVKQVSHGQWKYGCYLGKIKVKYNCTKTEFREQVVSSSSASDLYGKYLVLILAETPSFSWFFCALL
jgi:hypothetical protein